MYSICDALPQIASTWNIRSIVAPHAVLQSSALNYSAGLSRRTQRRQQRRTNARRTRKKGESVLVSTLRVVEWEHFWIKRKPEVGAAAAAGRVFERKSSLVPTFGK